MNLIWNRKAGTVFLSIILLLTGCGFMGGQKIENALDWQVHDFSFIDQEGKPYGLSDLKGKVWIADFIFTNCNTVCSPMTAHMASLQKQLKEQGLEAELVSFTVDPNQDNPETLKMFAEKMNADLTNWHFLTGYTEEEIKRLSEESFKSTVVFNTGDDQVMHGTSFFLVDQNGTAVKAYSGVNQASDEELIEDIRILLQ